MMPYNSGFFAARQFLSQPIGLY